MGKLKDTNKKLAQYKYTVSSNDYFRAHEIHYSHNNSITYKGLVFISLINKPTFDPITLNINKRPEANRPEPKNKITEAEKKELLDIVNTSKYKDLPASQIVPLLADEGKYIASERTLYRFLKEFKLNTKRLSTKIHNKRTVTTHIAHNSNEVWSWDITDHISFGLSPLSNQNRFFQLSVCF